jgi:hypothetical protein
MTDPDPKEPALVNLPLFRGKVRFNSFDRQLVDVITKVKSGRMTPDEAEAWAEEHGHSPFVFRPSDEVSTKALKERYWPFALAMAWIPTREPSAAMHAWNSYMTWGAARFAIQPKFVDAREELLAALRQDRVAASGRADLQRPREDIPAIAWLDLRLVRYGGHDRFYRDEASVAYIDVFVDAEQVRAVWPAPSPSQSKVRRTIATETDAKRQLIALILEQRDAPIPKPKLKPDFPGLSERAFDRIYLEAVAETKAPAWSAPGRRPKERGQEPAPGSPRPKSPHR